MLSYACALMGVRMHIFDSFAGLPPSESSYYKAGDFRGALDEVRRNVSQFGDLGCVEFHEGYFSDSVPRLHDVVGRLATLWMDVDLYDSARDVLAMLDRLDARGAVFSHDCVAPADLTAPRPRSPDDVLTAIVEAYAGAAVVPAGRHLFGTTSVFWSSASGVPVLDPAALMELAGPV